MLTVSLVFFFFYFTDCCTGCLPCVTRLMLRRVFSRWPLSRPHGGVWGQRSGSHPFQLQILRRKHPEFFNWMSLVPRRLILIDPDKPGTVKVHSFFFFTFLKRLSCFSVAMWQTGAGQDSSTCSPSTLKAASLVSAWATRWPAPRPITLQPSTSLQTSWKVSSEAQSLRLFRHDYFLLQSPTLFPVILCNAKNCFLLPRNNSEPVISDFSTCRKKISVRVSYMCKTENEKKKTAHIKAQRLRFSNI